MTGWVASAGRWLLAVGLAGIVVFSLWVYGDQERGADTQERLYFPSGRFLREATCGFREMAADYLWFQTVQYYGGFRRGEHDMRYFDLLIDGVTRLDRRFVEAYYFSSLVYCIDFGDIDRAVDVLRLGICANPDVASLPFHVGFMYYVFQKNYPRAAVWFDHAADRPDATDFHRRFNAFARKRAGQLEASLTLWRHLHDTASNPEMKKVAAEYIAECERLITERRNGTAKAGS